MDNLKVKRSPFISVIMPAYNHEKYVGAAIESVLSQTFTKFELIIINDGSTDNTEDVILSFPDDRIRYYAQDNADAHNAINRGLSLAAGRYISIINSDDIYHPDRLSQLLTVAEQESALFLFTGVSLVDGQGRGIDDPLHPAVRWYNGLVQQYEDTRSLEQTLLSGNVTVTTSNFFFARELLDTIGPFRPFRYAHDYDFALRALFHDPRRCRFLAENMSLEYRIHAGNTIAGVLEKVYRERFRILLDQLCSCGAPESQAAIAKSLDALYEEVVGAWENSRLQIGACHDSLSWKLTAPLRWLGKSVGL